MVASEFLDYLSKMQVATYVGVEDFADKFNFLYTVIILLLSSTVVTVKQYMMKPISCYMANDPGGKNIMDYVENYCWVQGTIPNDMNVALPETPEEWSAFEEKKILYYQWVPFVLGLQCVLFYLPRVIWQLFCYNRTGTDLQYIVSSANQAVHSDTETREKTVRHLAKTLEQMLFQHREYRSGCMVRLRLWFNHYCCLFPSKRMGTCLIVTYFFIKLLYLTNLVGQIFMMHRFLGISNDSTFFGITIANNIRRGKDWTSTQIFPRVTFCYLKLKQAGVTNSVTAQCVLPVNMLNEKIFIFLWFWISLTFCITAASVPTWLYRMSRYNSKDFIFKHLELTKDVNNNRKELSSGNVMVERFIDNFLRRDGIFILHVISINAGDLIVNFLIHELWSIYREKYPTANFSNRRERSTSLNGDDNVLLKLEPRHKAQQRKPTAPEPSDYEKPSQFV